MRITAIHDIVAPNTSDIANATARNPDERL
jgi:hypothetical protein